ncbi:MAG: HTTM domain-containing protein [Actinomycetota bacterium]|nr:HTTM domain-containing protein [Actinomycetota bacterium]
MSSNWERFWFEPVATSSLAVLRIGFGLVAFVWTLTLTPDLGAFFGHGGLVGGQPEAAGVWGVLAIFPGDFAVQVTFALLLIATVALTVGYQTRLAALLVFVGILSFERRDPYVFNTGDGLVRLIAFYLMLAPSGAALSVDRWRTAREHFWEFPLRAPWALRLMQIQLSVLYLSGLWIKLQGTTWNNGTAVSYAMRISDLSRFPLPGFLIHSALICNLMTYGTLAIELSIPILVWNRRLRPWALLAGLGLHLGIEYSIRVGFFSLAMFTLYLSFLDPTGTQVRLLALRERRRRRAGVGAPQPVAQT